MLLLATLVCALAAPPLDAAEVLSTDTGASTSGDPDVAGDVAPTSEPDAPLLGRPYTPSRPGQITVDSPYWDLEVMYAQEQHAEGWKLAEARYAETRDPHLTLHIARFAYQLLEGDESRSRSEREAIYVEALRVLDEGIDAAPDDIHLHFARGVVLARLGTTRGVLSSLRMATDIESAWARTIDSDFVYHSIGPHEQLPCDAHLALGVFYRLVPDSFVVKLLAGTRGDLDRSLELHQAGVACAGERIRNLKELGVTQLCLGQKRKDDALMAEGRASLNRVLAIPPVMKEEFVDLKHAVTLLKDPSLACGYSRDGQQDVDASKL